MDAYAVDVRGIGDAVVLQVRGHLDDSAGEVVADLVTAAVATDAGQIVLDLDQVTSCTPSGARAAFPHGRPSCVRLRIGPHTPVPVLAAAGLRPRSR